MNSGTRWRRSGINGSAAVVLAIGAAVWPPTTEGAELIVPVVVVPSGGIDIPTVQTTPGGTVILRGGGGPKPDATELAPERRAVNFPSTPPPTPPQGFDNNFDARGIDQNFDRHGLTRP